MIRIVCLSCLLLASFLSFASEPSINIFLDLLLDINDEEHDSLEHYKHQERVYLNYRGLVSEQNVQLNDIKYFLFIGYVADQKNVAGLQQALASDFLVVFQKHKSEILSVLKDSPYLMPSACYSLGRHFGFEGRNKEKFKPFIDSNKALITEHLGSVNGELCINTIVDNTFIEH